MFTHIFSYQIQQTLFSADCFFSKILKVLGEIWCLITVGFHKPAPNDVKRTLSPDGTGTCQAAMLSISQLLLCGISNFSVTIMELRTESPVEIMDRNAARVTQVNYVFIT